MEPSDAPRPSPRREVALQGPRPTPLKVSKDSHKIRKPPVAPGHSHQQPPPQQVASQYQQHPRPPVIIYSVSPKVIHAQPGDFMALVQRLTGLSGSSDAASSAADPFGAAAGASAADPFLLSPSGGGGALSPAARIASFETSQSHAHAHAHAPDTADRPQVGVMDQLDMDGGFMVNRPPFQPGILSPATLPPISPILFSPSFDPSLLNFLHELSPMFATNPAANAGAAAATTTINNNNYNNNFSTTNNRSFMDIGGSSFLTSPSNSLFSTPTVPSPGGAFWDLLNQLPDF